MGIDLLENSELSALAPSRIGNKCFVDDNNYQNFLGIGDKKKEERYEREARESLNARWSINPKYKNDCDYLQKQLEKILAEIDAENKKNYPARLRRRFIVPREDLVVQYKQAIIESECVVKKEQTEKAAEQKNTLDTLATITNAPPQLPQDEQKADNKNKYIIYGVGGVILLIAIAVLIKK